MKLFFAAAVVAFAKHASAFRVVQEFDGNYCIVQVKYTGAAGTEWGTSLGTIVSTPAGVFSDGNGDPTIAQNGINDPLGEILAMVQAFTDPADVTVYDEGGGTALSPQPTDHVPSSLNFCQMYSTSAPEHYCKGDGSWAQWQEASLYSTIAECCERNHPSSSYNDCIEKASGIKSMGDGKWYGDYQDQKCVRNCDTANLFDPASTDSLELHAFADSESYECGGFKSWTGEADFADVADCCDDRFNHLQEAYCEYQSTTGSAPSPTPAYAGTSKWYADGSNSLCKTDCIVSSSDVTCGGIIKEADIVLYADEATCCSEKLSWLSSAGCEARSANGEGEPTNLFWATPDGCREDCDGNTNCVSAPSNAKLYADATTCCKQANAWLYLDWCTTRAANTFDGSSSSSTGTSDWYVDYEAGVCRQDCLPDSSDPQCDFASSGSLTFYSTAADCCRGSLGSVDQDACELGSAQGLTIRTVPTGRWYVSTGGSGGDQPCKKDCEVISGDPECGGIVAKNGIRLYASAAECCNQAYSWVDKDLCELESLNADTPTNKWYVDYGANVCKEDCVVGTGASCFGRPEDQSTTMFSTPSACCDAKLSWIDSDICETSSTTGIDPTDSDSPGTGAWRKNNAWSYCVLDCKESGDIETGDPILDVQPLVTSGVADAAGDLFVDLVPTDPYPDQCDGVTSDSSADQYGGSVSNCCNSITWVQEEVCESLSTGVKTEMYFSKPSDRTQCVVHQVADITSAPNVICVAGVETAMSLSEGVTCEADIEVSTKLYSSLEDCCKANVSWDVDGCRYGSQGTSAPGSGKFYVDWSVEQCAQDCTDDTAGTSCGGIANSWETLYTSASACCDRLSWLPRSKCQFFN